MVQILILLVLLSVSAYTQAQDTEAQLYYYSDEQSAFIIETVDSSQSRILAHFSLPENYSIIGPGWSADGRWFAWATDTIGGGIMEPEPPFSIWIVDRNGTTTTQLHEGGQVLHMEWSPTNSMLLMIYVDTTDQFTHVLEIVDAQTNQGVFRTELDDFYWWARIPQSFWLPNSLHFILYATSGTQNIYTMSVHTITGEKVADRRIYYPQTQIWRYQALPTWSSDGKAMYVSADTKNLVIDDLFGLSSIELTLEEDSLAFVDWSPSGQFALVYTGSLLFDEFTNIDLWLYDDESQDIMLISENPQPNYSNWRGGWVTDRPTSSWRSDSAIAFFFDESRSLYTINPENRETVEIVPEELAYLDVRNFNNGLWDNSGNLYYVAEGSPLDAALLRYDPLVNEHEIIHEGVTNFALHPDYVAITNCDDGSGSYGCILDLENMKENLVRFDYSVYIGSPTGYLWHSSGDWAIMVGARTNTFGSIGVTDQDTEDVRQLDVYCYLSESCYGWLPEPNP